MGDAENALPTSKKRAAGREISKDNPGLDDDEDSSEQETGTFKRASDEVLATRRIVKVKRSQTTLTTTNSSSNPFAGLRLVNPAEAHAASTTLTTEVVTTSEKVSEVKHDTGEKTEEVKDQNAKQSESKTDSPVAETSAEKETVEDKENDNAASETTKDKVDEHEPAEDTKNENEKLAEDDKTENEKPAGDDKTEREKSARDDKKENEEKDNGTENANPSGEGTPLSSFQQLSSSQNAFTGLAGTGFSTSTFTFTSIPKDGSAFGTTGFSFGQKSDQPFSFGLSNNGSSSIFGTTGSSIVSKSEGSGFPTMQEVPVETGEENERVVFIAESVLFEFLDGAWKERGKGEVKVNVSTTNTEKARLLMRARGNYRLILNASLYPDMKLTNMDKRGITFACVNSVSESKDGLSTFALKFKDVSIVEEFRAVVTAHKDNTPTALKTPENSPKASDE